MIEPDPRISFQALADGRVGPNEALMRIVGNCRLLGNSYLAAVSDVLTPQERAIVEHELRKRTEDGD